MQEIPGEIRRAGAHAVLLLNTGISTIEPLQAATDKLSGELRIELAIHCQRCQQMRTLVSLIALLVLHGLHHNAGRYRGRHSDYRCCCDGEGTPKSDRRRNRCSASGKDDDG